MGKHDVVHSDPNILGGTPVFVGTRVPVQTLFDYLDGGESLDTFLEHFPTVGRDQATAVIELEKAQSEDICWALELHAKRQARD
jgi:uncharacterized protein (DUF433 family)